MAKRVAVESLTLTEVKDLFLETLRITLPRTEKPIEDKMKKLTRSKISYHKWIKSYEIFKPSKMNFYCEKGPKATWPTVSIGMIHRTRKGLILMALDHQNGGSPNLYEKNDAWDEWVTIYPAHFCERYAERIMKVSPATFGAGADGIMFSTMGGVMRVTEDSSDDVQEIEYQFMEGQSFGYRDNKNKVVYFKTVYSNDMLKGDRLKFNEEMKETLSFIYGSFGKE